MVSSAGFLLNTLKNYKIFSMVAFSLLGLLTSLSLLHLGRLKS